MKIEFSTGLFEFSQGRLPRGRGSWAFQFAFSGDESPWFARMNGRSSLTYGEAKKLAEAEARRRNCSNVIVLP